MRLKCIFLALTFCLTTTNAFPNPATIVSLSRSSTVTLNEDVDPGRGSASEINDGNLSGSSFKLNIPINFEALGRAESKSEDIPKNAPDKTQLPAAFDAHIISDQANVNIEQKNRPEVGKENNYTEELFMEINFKEAKFEDNANNKQFNLENNNKIKNEENLKERIPTTVHISNVNAQPMQRESEFTVPVNNIVKLSLASSIDVLNKAKEQNLNVTNRIENVLNQSESNEKPKYNVRDFLKAKRILVEKQRANDAAKNRETFKISLQKDETDSVRIRPAVHSTLRESRPNLVPQSCTVECEKLADKATFSCKENCNIFLKDIMEKHRNELLYLEQSKRDEIDQKVQAELKLAENRFKYDMERMFKTENAKFNQERDTLTNKIVALQADLIKLRRENDELRVNSRKFVKRSVTENLTTSTEQPEVQKDFKCSACQQLASLLFLAREKRELSETLNSTSSIFKENISKAEKAKILLQEIGTLVTSDNLKTEQSSQISSKVNNADGTTDHTFSDNESDKKLAVQHDNNEPEEINFKLRLSVDSVTTEDPELINEKSSSDSTTNEEPKTPKTNGDSSVPVGSNGDVDSKQSAQEENKSPDNQNTPEQTEENLHTTAEDKNSEINKDDENQDLKKGGSEDNKPTEIAQNVATEVPVTDDALVKTSPQTNNEVTELPQDNTGNTDTIPSTISTITEPKDDNEKLSEPKTESDATEIPGHVEKETPSNTNEEPKADKQIPPETKEGEPAFNTNEDPEVVTDKEISPEKTVEKPASNTDEEPEANTEIPSEMKEKDPASNTNEEPEANKEIAPETKGGEPASNTNEEPKVVPDKEITPETKEEEAASNTNEDPEVVTDKEIPSEIVKEEPVPNTNELPEVVTEKEIPSEIAKEEPASNTNKNPEVVTDKEIPSEIAKEEPVPHTNEVPEVVTEKEIPSDIAKEEPVPNTNEDPEVVTDKEIPSEIAKEEPVSNTNEVPEVVTDKEISSEIAKEEPVSNTNEEPEVVTDKEIPSEIAKEEPVPNTNEEPEVVTDKENPSETKEGEPVPNTNEEPKVATDKEITPETKEEEAASNTNGEPEVATDKEIPPEIKEETASNTKEEPSPVKDSQNKNDAPSPSKGGDQVKKSPQKDTSPPAKKGEETETPEELHEVEAPEVNEDYDNTGDNLDQTGGEGDEIDY